MKIDMYPVNWPDVVASAPGVVHQTFAPGGAEVRHYVPGTSRPGNWYTVYVHMTNVVPRGTVLKQGDRVGTPGSVGTRARHLHYEQLHDRSGRGDAITSDMVRPAFAEHNNGNPFPMPVGEPGITLVSQNRRGAAPPPKGPNLNRAQTEFMIAQAMRAHVLGGDRGPFTRKKYPGWVRPKNRGVNWQIAEIEKRLPKR
jgi:murein DD-endopeptidase MepM/ murein hydrolase activator NlpD